jgi:hypothetical protein
VTVARASPSSSEISNARFPAFQRSATLAAVDPGSGLMGSWGRVNLASCSPAASVSATIPRPTRKRGPVLVHISDLHFGFRDGKSVHRFDADPSGMSLARQLFEEFRGTLSEMSFDSRSLYLIVSGDLTWNRSPGEFTKARDCLETFCETIDLPRERVSFVPGNHDVSWHLSKDRGRDGSSSLRTRPAPRADPSVHC